MLACYGGIVGDPRDGLVDGSMEEIGYHRKKKKSGEENEEGKYLGSKDKRDKGMESETEDPEDSEGTASSAGLAEGQTRGSSPTLMELYLMTQIERFEEFNKACYILAKFAKARSKKMAALREANPDSKKDPWSWDIHSGGRLLFTRCDTIDLIYPLVNNNNIEASGGVNSSEAAGVSGGVIGASGGAVTEAAGASGGVIGASSGPNSTGSSGRRKTHVKPHGRGRRVSNGRGERKTHHGGENMIGQEMISIRHRAALLVIKTQPFFLMVFFMLNLPD